MTMRRFLMFLAFLVLLAAGVFIVLVMTLDEDRAKRLINAQVKAQTGQELSIHGDLRWRLFPSLALAAQDIRLSNPPDFPARDMLEVGRLQASVKLWPLLRRQIRIGDVVLEDAVVRLQTDAQGHSNLAQVMAVAGETDDTGASAPGLSTGQVRLRNVTLAVSDAMRDTSNQFLIEDFRLSAFAFDTPVDFEFRGSLGTPPALADIRAAGQLQVAASLEALQIAGLALSGRLADAALDIQLDGDVNAALAPLAVELSQGELSVAGQPLAVAFSYRDAQPPLITAQIHGQSLDLDQLLAQVRQVENDPAGSHGDHALAFLRQVDLDAELVLDRLILAGLVVSQAQASAQSRGGVLVVEPLAGVLDGGRVDARAEIDLRPVQPVIRIEPVFELESLARALQPWGLDERLDGRGRLALELTTHSLDPDTMLERLSGQGHYEFVDGVLHGLDFGALVGAVSERDLLRAATEAAGGQTPFELFSGRVQIADGVLALPDLKLATDTFGMEGDLVLGLSGLELDGRLRLDQPRLQRLPLSVGGTLSAPRLGVDAEAAVREEAGRRLLDQIRRRLED